jgi:DNA polymerase-3 subunit alpha
MFRILDIEKILDVASKRLKDKAEGQVSIFDMLGDDAAGTGFEEEVPPPDGQEWDRSEKLRFEKETLKMYVSDHPLSPYADTLKDLAEFSLGDLMATAEAAVGEESDDEDAAGLDGGISQVKVPQNRQIKLAGMVTSVNPMVSRKGDRMAKFVLEDMEGNMEMIVFPQSYAKCGELLQEDAIVAVQGKFEVTDRGAQVLVNNIMELKLVKKERGPQLRELIMPAAAFNQNMSDDLNRLLQRFPGIDPVVIVLEQNNGNKLRSQPLPFTVDGTNASLTAEFRTLISV